MLVIIIIIIIIRLVFRAATNKSKMEWIWEILCLEMGIFFSFFFFVVGQGNKQDLVIREIFREDCSFYLFIFSLFDFRDRNASGCVYK